MRLTPDYTQIRLARSGIQSTQGRRAMDYENRKFKDSRDVAKIWGSALNRGMTPPEMAKFFAQYHQGLPTGPQDLIKRFGDEARGPFEKMYE